MIYILLALTNGAITVVSRVVNAALAARVGSLRGSFVNHIVGALAAGILLLMGIRTGLFQLSEIPLVYFSGGCLGVIVVAASNYAVRKMGVVLFVVLLIGFQLLTSAVLDHFGLLGGDVIPLTGGRLLGLIFLLIGAILVVTDRARQRESISSSGPPKS